MSRYLSNNSQIPLSLPSRAALRAAGVEDIRIRYTAKRGRACRRILSPSLTRMFLLPGHGCDGNTKSHYSE